MELKVLQLAPLYKPLVIGMGYGSIERIVMGLDATLTKLGVDSYVSALSGSNITGNLLDVPVNHKDLYEAQAEIVLNFLQNKNIDIVHIHRRNFLKTQAFSLCRSKNIPVLYTLHGPVEDLLKKFDFSINISTLDNLFFNAVSRYQATDLSKLFPIEEIIYNGIDTTLYSYVDNPKCDYFLSIGRLNREKGAHVAIQFAREAKTPLIIVGNIEDQSYFESAIKPHLDNVNMRFVGELTDRRKIPFYQHAAAVLMMGEYNDPCPLVAMEALACGTPVIAFRKGGIPEIVEDCRNGILLSSIDDGLKRIKDLSNIDRKACRDEIESNFSLIQMTKKYLTLYSKLIEKVKRKGT